MAPVLLQHINAKQQGNEHHQIERRAMKTSGPLEVPVKKYLRTAIGDRWPSLQYLSLGVYSAWILLCMGSSSVAALFGNDTTGQWQGSLYISSGCGLILGLLLFGTLSHHTQKAIERGPLSLVMGLLASISTALVYAGGLSSNFTLFLFFSFCTGLGTSVVCLRIGFITSKLNGSWGFFTICAAGLLSNLLFFLCRSMPPSVALPSIAILPALAVVLSFAQPTETTHANGPNDLIDIRSLPKHYFLRLIVAVFVFSSSVGIVKGLSALTQSAQGTVNQASIEVFASFVIVGLLMVAVAVILQHKNFEISKIYLPIVFIASFFMLVTSLLGDDFSTLRSVCANTLYNIFALLIWCLLVDLAGRTTLQSNKVFGFGRGASAAGTTIGWIIAFYGQDSSIPASLHSTILVVLAVAIVFVAIFAFNNGCISDALAKTRLQPNGHTSTELASADSQTKWLEACRSLAQKAELTARETEVLILLSRGRTISYIADELCLSYNTVKGYTRNVYTKLDTHSRQNLIDLVEAETSA